MKLGLLVSRQYHVIATEKWTSVRNVWRMKRKDFETLSQLICWTDRIILYPDWSLKGRVFRAASKGQLKKSKKHVFIARKEMLNDFYQFEVGKVNGIYHYNFHIVNRLDRWDIITPAARLLLQKNSRMRRRIIP